MSRHTLVEQIEMQQLGSAETRHCHSLSELVKATGLTCKSIIAGRRGLERRRLITVEEGFDGSQFNAPEIRLNNEFIIDASRFPTPAITLLQSTPGPRRTWQPAVTKPLRSPSEARDKTRSEKVAPVVLESCHGGTVNVAPVTLEGCHPGTGDVALVGLESCHLHRTSPLNESFGTSPVNSSPVRNPGTNQHLQAGAAVSANAGGKASQDGGKLGTLTAEERAIEKRKSVIALRVIRLTKHMTDDERQTFDRDATAGDVGANERLLKEVEARVVLGASA